MHGEIPHIPMLYNTSSIITCALEAFLEAFLKYFHRYKHEPFYITSYEAGFPAIVFTLWRDKKNKLLKNLNKVCVKLT